MRVNVSSLMIIGLRGVAEFWGGLRFVVREKISHTQKARGHAGRAVSYLVRRVKPYTKHKRRKKGRKKRK